MTPQPQQPRPSPQGQTPLSMNMNVSPEKRSALKNYLEGYKDAIQKKSMDQLLPNISAPQMPMQQPMQQPMQPPMMPQQPMMMNMGGVVDVFEPQYMRNGGITVGGSFTNEDLKQAKEIVDSVKQLPDKVNRDNALKNIEDMAVGYSPTALTAARGMMGDYDPDFGEEMGSLDYTPQGEPVNVTTITGGGGGPYDGGQFFDMPFRPKENVSDDDLRMDEDKVESINPMYEDFKKSQESMFAPFVNKIGSIMGYDDPFDLYKATQATLDDKSMQSSIARDRLKDQEREERRLAEEQRMRDMIQGMLPATESTETAPVTNPIVDPVADPVAPDYSSVVVPSDRVPDFTIPALPSLPATSPLLPPGISPELIRNLLAMQGSSVTNMQEGGSVNKLDNAVDNFLSSLKG